jgi:hypothetical protein
MPKEMPPQFNFNTILLTICMGLSGWALKSINDLENQLSGLYPVVGANGTAITGINSVNKEQSVQIEDLSNRLTKLEQQQADLKR